MAEQNSYDFWTRYSNLCLKCKVCPLKSVIKHMRGTTLTCLVERIRSEHWQFLLSALSVDNSLTEVIFKSDLPPLDEQKELWSKRRRRKDEEYPIPYGYSAQNISDICKYSARLLTVSQTLQSLVIDNIPLTLDDAKHLAEGLTNSNITEFAVKNYPHSTEAIAAICKGLWDSKVAVLDFTACNLNLTNLKCICIVIMKHKERRALQTFPETLRYQMPRFEEMRGLNRITLNGNNIGDTGVKILCGALNEDHWIQALDLQCCNVSDYGAMTILKEVTVNNMLYVVDLRSNNIDDALMMKISRQLDINMFGKIPCYTTKSLWKPRLPPKIVPPRKIMLKSKALKKYTKISPVKKRSSLEHAFRISYEIIDNKGTQDASVQTESTKDPEQLQERIRQLEYKLLKEMSLRDSFMDLSEKFRLENNALRLEVMKLSSFEDVILIDQETYTEITHTFQKFRRFLQLMKDYGLWELATTIGVADYENTKLKAVPNNSKVCLVEKEQDPLDFSQVNDPVKEQSCPKPQARCCSCRKPDCISNKNPVSKLSDNQNFTQEKLPVKKSVDKSQVKKIVNKSKVSQMFKEIRESFTNDFSKQPIEKPPLSQSFQKLDTATHLPPHFQCRCLYQANVNVPTDFASCKTRKQLYEAVRNELIMQTYPCCCPLHPICPPQLFQHPPVIHDMNYHQDAYCQTHTDYNSQNATPVDLSTSASAFHEPSLPGSLDSTSISFASEGGFTSDSQQAVNLVSRDWEEDMNNCRHSNTEVTNSSPQSNSFKDLKKSELEVVFPDEPDDDDCDYSSDNSGYSYVPKESDYLPNVAKASLSDIKDKFSQSSNKTDSDRSSKLSSGRSYRQCFLEALSYTNEKSFSKIEVFDSHIEIKSSHQSPQKLGKVVSGDNSKSSNTAKKNSKSSKKIKNQKLSNQTGDGKSTSQKKESVSSSSVPSLSDITTVSSHSLNTDSVMGQLSGSEKGFS